MKYEVKTVEPHELPEGVERVIVQRGDRPPVLIITGEAARCWEFMRRWEATLVEPPWEPSVCLPLLRAV